MVTGAYSLRLLCLGLLLSVAELPAKDLAAYRTGDLAGETISTPVALDVIDAEATAARRTAEALKTPAIFRYYPETTNVITKEFIAAFESNRTVFVTALQAAFGEITNAQETVAAPGFAGFVAGFNRTEIPFPVSSELAGVWAGGDAGAAIQARLLNSLLQGYRRPVRSEELPAGLVLGETMRLVTVGSPSAKLTLADADRRGKLAIVTSTGKLKQLRNQFYRSFTPEEQPMAIALGKFLQPTCEVDASLTRQARERDTRQLVLADHYDAGQVIVQRGEIIDAKMKAALVQLNEKMIPGQLDAQLAAQQDRLRTQLEHSVVQKVREQVKAREQEIIFQNQILAARVRNKWLLAALVGILLVALAALGILARNRRRAGSLVPARAELSLQPHEFYQASLAPQVAQILKAAVVQGLAAQRSELLQAQQTAAAEINALVRRLDELKAPMQDRLHSYEERIAELEKDLAERNEENRELLRLKIEMTRRQLEAERVRNRVDFN